MSWITSALVSEFDTLGRLMFHTIRTGARAYTVPQRAVWVRKVPQGRGWQNRLNQMDIRVARSMHGPVGFVAMTGAGYVDFAYVLPIAQGQGHFRALLQDMIDRHPHVTMTTHASLHAQPAFAAMGFQIERHEVVRRQGQRLCRAFMKRV